MDLKGKVAFVTGGSGDIGGAIARALATAGADVAISYVGQLEAAATTVDALRAAGRRSLAVQLDQRDAAAIAASVDRVVTELGRVVGASERTLSRLCRSELGMTFPQWRTQLRLHAALIRLAEGESVTRVHGLKPMATVGYRSAVGSDNCRATPS